MTGFSAPRVSGVSEDLRLTNVINRLAAAGFLDMLNEEGKTAPKAPIIQIGEHQYKVIDVEDDSTRASDLNRELDLERFAQPKVENPAENSGDNKEPSSDSKSSDNDAKPAANQPQGVHPGIVIFLNPVSPKEFLASLPASLRSFIEDTVKIIRQKTMEGANNYRFSFSELKLDISFVTDSDGLTIRILSEDKMGQSSLLNKENQVILLNVLQREFPDENVKVVFEGTAEQARGGASGGHGGSGQGRDNNSEKPESADEE